jgi:Ca2+-binding EF-hand superfamily protein
MSSNRLKGFALALAAAGGFALPSIVSADNEKGSADNNEGRFESMDTNDDGKISIDEHGAAATKMFNTMDANKDGRVTASEMEAAHKEITGKKAMKGEMTAAEKIRVIDSDGDGVLTEEEYLAGAKSMFEKMDTNQDGFLSKAEVKAGQQKYMPRKPAK